MKLQGRWQQSRSRRLTRSRRDHRPSRRDRSRASEPRVAMDAGDGVRAMAWKAWMKREQWFTWIAAAIVLTNIVLAAIG
jgi:hypothetical protein